MSRNRLTLTITALAAIMVTAAATPAAPTGRARALRRNQRGSHRGLLRPRRQTGPDGAKRATPRRDPTSEVARTGRPPLLIRPPPLHDGTDEPRQRQVDHVRRRDQDPRPESDRQRRRHLDSAREARLPRTSATTGPVTPCIGSSAEPCTRSSSTTVEHPQTHPMTSSWNSCGIVRENVQVNSPDLDFCEVVHNVIG